MNNDRYSNNNDDEIKPLKGVIVLEMAGLAPVPYCGMILSDFGADVIRIDKASDGEILSNPFDNLSRGKRSIAIDLKSKHGKSLFFELTKKANVIIDSYRPGVMEKLGFSPSEIHSVSPHIIYSRLTGYGQNGPYSKMAGHDINYIALSGVLSIIGRKDENPIFPSNILGDFAAGGMLCALGIVMALFEQQKQISMGMKPIGKVIDSSMMDGATYLASFIYKLKQSKGIVSFDQPRGYNMLDTGSHYYEVYKTKDGKFISVGSIEPQFYEQLLTGLGIDPSDEQLPHQNDQDQWPNMKKRFQQIFLTKTRDEWESIFKGTDACVAPVLEMDEIQNHPHCKSRPLVDTENGTDILPAPKFSNLVNHSTTPSFKIKPMIINPGNDSIEILKQLGFNSNDIQNYQKSSAFVQFNKSKL
eukprot:gene3814-4746_t